MNRVRENSAVQIRFLIGPAGSGKTFQCLSEVRAALRQSPGGPPLIFLAPKQATFQIERALLADENLAGYTRLQIHSFDRLADYVLSELGGGMNDALSEQGRVMVLRALLAREEKLLRIFRSTARLSGFAAQLSALLREFQQSRITPERLLEASARASNRALADKLHDVSLILRSYREWLDANHLEDAHTLLDRAAEALTRESKDSGAFGVPGVQLWLDGFAEMTPQELNLLAAFVTRCERATIAFCLEAEPAARDEGSWLSLWTVVAQTFRRCKHVLAALPNANVSVHSLSRDANRSRFSSSPALAAVERNWSSGEPANITSSPAIRVVPCANPEAEAIFAAREILHVVREEAARFRDCAVLVRTLDGYHDTLRRVFTRYGIPFFLDRRESVAHHPLAELTRFALRTVAFGWKRDDWFGALKTGLVHPETSQLDELENEALRHGWEGTQWTTPLPDADGKRRDFESLRRKITPAFERLGDAVRGEISGAQLASALETFWSELDVERRLQRWSEEAKDIAPTAALVHDSVWQQVNSWLGDVKRAFSSQTMSVREWLGILEAGLSGLTVGVIPPALDQVLVGTIDRSRNPELRLALVLGMNEGVFPAPPPRPPILNEQEREALTNALEGKHHIALSARQRLAHERYFAYIACTRSRERLVLTFAAADARGRALNPSPLLSHLNRIAPGVFPPKQSAEVFSAPDWRDAEHAVELAAPLLTRAHAALEPLRGHEAFVDLVARWNEIERAATTPRLAAEIASRLYANPLRTSVSALENFAECPFRFFLNTGLRVKEREEFEVDHRQRGSFQHEVLRVFHDRATANGGSWRKLTSQAARELIRAIGEEQLATYADGLFNADDASRFTARVLIQNLENLIGTTVEWMRSYQFDPHRVELEFGFDESKLPAWRISLGDGRELHLRGRVDRVDLLPQPDGTALAVVVDYKSSPRKVDATKLHHGLELQLLSYLGVLRDITPADDLPKLQPVGVFYVGLRGNYKSAGSREEPLTEADLRRRRSFQHSGRYNEACYAHFDRDGLNEQFSKHPLSKNALGPDDFQTLTASVENHLREFGRRILDGVIEIAPYRKGSETACDYCEFHSVCRFDSWVEPFRKLDPPPKPSKPAKEPKPRAKKARAS